MLFYINNNIDNHKIATYNSGVTQNAFTKSVYTMHYASDFYYI